MTDYEYMDMSDEEKRIYHLEQKIDNLKKTLGTLISWMSGSSVSPINVGEAKRLLEMLEEEE